MYPVLAKIGPITVYSYGVMVAVGFSVAAFLSSRRAPSFNIDGNSVIDLFIIMLVSGILGARLLYIALNPGYYISNPLEIPDLSKGGLVWYGGFFAALAAAYSYLRVKRIDFWNAADLVVPYLALGQAIGRIGCYLNGCCYGKDAWPVQLYASALLFAMFIVLRFWQDRRRFFGEIFLGYGLLYAIKRFFIEFLRDDNPRILFNLTMSQIISAAVFVVVFLLFMRKAHIWKRRNSR